MSKDRQEREIWYAELVAYLDTSEARQTRFEFWTTESLRIFTAKALKQQEQEEGESNA